MTAKKSLTSSKSVYENSFSLSFVHWANITQHKETIKPKNGLYSLPKYNFSPASCAICVQQSHQLSAFSDTHFALGFYSCNMSCFFLWPGRT